MSTYHLKRRISVVMVLLMSVLIFVVQNMALIEIQLFNWTIDVRRSILIGIVLIIGFVIGWSARSVRSKRS